jgi:outer membrane receptor protein involved in Fe transport
MRPVHAVALAALLGGFAAWAQSQQSVVWKLEVRDPLGSPISGAICAVDTGLIETRAGADGVCVLRNLTPGRHRLEVKRNGFQTRVIEIDPPKPVSPLVLTIDPAKFSTTVVATTPLPGIGLDRSEIAAPVQVVGAGELSQSGSLDLSDLLNRRLNGVYWNEIQNNPFQADVNYRGYTASPLLGTPQGLSIYMDGVRLNQPFGDIVSWDLIPRAAIQEVALMPGSNPLFGLNTLGGAISVQTKDGFTSGRTSLTGLLGNYGRKSGEFEQGGSTSRGYHWFLTGNLFGDDGWRESSPSTVRQLFGKTGRQTDKTSIGFTAAYANNALKGNGLQETRLLDRDYASVYTKPDITAHRAIFLNTPWRRNVNSHVTLNGNVYYRYIRTRTLNGDINENSLDQSVYQPSAAERAALTAAGYSGFPTSGATAANTPFPYWRCIANVLLRDEPAEKCNGLINRSAGTQHNGGASGQATWAYAKHQLTAGAAFDRSSSAYSQTSELGYLNPDRSITGLNAFADGVTGGAIDGEPFDTRVILDGHSRTASVFASQLYRPGRGFALQFAGRFNATTIENRDRLRPGGGPGSLDGRHTFQRFNPSAGVTYTPIADKALNLYFSYGEGSRAPTSIELGCADPNEPCRLPNSMAGDPPLLQVVTRTLEAGVRDKAWSVGWFRAVNRDDILFVASQQTGYGYFKNFGETSRQGLQADVRMTRVKWTAGAGYTFLDSVFRSAEVVNGESNSSGNDGVQRIQPGNRIPLTPRHLFKSFLDLTPVRRATVNVGLVATSSSYARGNEDNQHRADGQYFLGPGSSDAYAVVSLGGRYQLTKRLQWFGQINNLLNTRYATAAQLGVNGFTAAGTFVARPFPARPDGEFPLVHSTFYAPGSPRIFWTGLRLQF